MANFYNLIYKINTTESEEILFTNVDEYLNPILDRSLAKKINNLKKLELEPNEKIVNNILEYLYE